ncbi:hypothetical protein OIY81_267 [Cryptosporidium canis]|uniref:Mediator of RNA polymerase II transcription subunit 10 n=1 Tax=Cryptosporidium canis TaxID=195482 RepID=A0ABQ8P5Y1_9CRYT|nr:hypothetical protein OJ252_2187 [Cryptosporidium canis]KAJ1614794.1 hypothetical protein OIY81_267 [Cryptosporidium canis]
MLFSSRAPISSPNSEDTITKLQTTLNNILHCLTDALYLLPDLAPKVTCCLQLDDDREVDAARHDILYRANYISMGFECSNDLISKMTHLKPLNGDLANSFLKKLEELRIQNEGNIKELINTSKECKTVLKKINANVNKYIEDSISKCIKLNDTENKMDMTPGEIYEISDCPRTYEGI